MELNLMEQNVLQRRVSKLLLPADDKNKQTDVTCLGKLVQ